MYYHVYVYHLSLFALTSINVEAQDCVTALVAYLHVLLLLFIALK